MAEHKDDNGEISDVEAQFGRAFQRFWDDLEDQVDLLREAVPAVFDRQAEWDDVRNAAPALKIPADKVEEFAAVWVKAYGTEKFEGILSDAMKKASTFEDDPSGDEAAIDAGTPDDHEPVEAPEGEADYEVEVLRFIYEHGSFLDLQRAMRRYVGFPKHVRTIVRASVLFAVSSLENAVAAIERARLRTHPAAAGAGAGDEKKYSLDDLIRLGDIEAVVAEAIEKRVENLCYGSLDDWRNWFQRSFKRDLAELALDWDEVCEVVQRRHIIMHNHGEVSRLYLERTAGKEGVEVGTYLPLTPEYVYGALDQVSVLGLRMLTHAWEKLGDDPEHLLLHLHLRSYDALVAERWALTIAVADEICERGAAGTEPVLVAQVNRWLARSALGDDITKEVADWDVGSLRLRFQLAKPALLNDFDALSGMVPRAIKAGELRRDELLSWPLFKPLRSEPEFIELLSSVTRPPEVDD